MVCVSALLFYAVIVQKYVLISYHGNLAGPLSRVLIDIESHSGVYEFHVFGSTNRL